MILTQNEAPPVIGGDIVCKAEKYTISEDAINHIGALLEGQYRHPEKAVIREYVSNALDAHRMFGVDKKVVVHLPVPTDPVFRVRDFGPGLSLEHFRSASPVVSRCCAAISSTWSRGSPRCVSARGHGPASA